jgi:hypothetical protein
MRLLITILFVALIGLSVALPSDLIQTKPLPGKISLSGTTAESIKAIDALNDPLAKFQLTNLPNIGHYASWALTYDQDTEKPVGVPEKLLNFSEKQPENLTSVGNPNADFVPVASPSGVSSIPVY